MLTGCLYTPPEETGPHTQTIYPASDPQLGRKSVFFREAARHRADFSPQDTAPIWGVCIRLCWGHGTHDSSPPKSSAVSDG